MMQYKYVYQVGFSGSRRWKVEGLLIRARMPAYFDIDWLFFVRNKTSPYAR
jgi:hypothetical protein